MYLVAYDIADPKRLQKIRKKCLEYGIKIQKSVFLIDSKSSQIEKFTKEVISLSNKEEDSLIILPICQKCYQKLQQFGIPINIESFFAEYLVL